MTAPGPVSATSVAASPSAGPASTWAMPKSRSLPRLSPVTMTFSGLMSRWMTPAACACTSASRSDAVSESACGNGSGPRPQPVAQRLARDELHREKRDAIRLPGLEEGRDRGMLQPGARLGLPDEPGPRFGRQRLRQHLDRRHTAEREIAGEEDLAHASGPQALLDAIVREGATDQASPPRARLSPRRAAYNPAHLTLSAGSRLGPYEILAPIGAGGMGEVYRAKDAKLGREIAIKVLPSATASDPDRRQRFEKEARSASALNHPNILTIYDIGESDGTVYIAMELVEGKTLRELVASGEPVPTKKLLDVAVQTAEGLAKAHSAGIVHRDLKPENIMVSKDGFAKILDFGLAKLTEAPSQDESVVADRDRGADAARHRHGHGGLHVARAGERPARRLPLRPVHARHDPLRDGDGQARVPAQDRRRDARRDHPRGARAAVAARSEGPGSRALDRRAPARQGPRRALRLDQGPRARPQERARPPFGDFLLRRAGGGRARESLRRRRLARARRSRALLVGTGLGLPRAGRSRRQAGRADSVQAADVRARPNQGGALRARRPDDRLQRGLGGAAPEMFSTRADMRRVALARDLPGADRARRLVHRRARRSPCIGGRSSGYQTMGTLARVPLAGGAPREILESVQDADWSPDGRVSRRVPRRGQPGPLEYPVGKVLYETPGWVSGIRVSPDGRLLAFVEHIQRGNNNGHLRIIDTAGKVRLAGPFARLRRPGVVAEGRRNLVEGRNPAATSVDGKNRTRVGSRRTATSRTSPATGAFSCG